MNTHAATEMSVSDLSVEQFCADPTAYFDNSHTKIQSVPRDELKSLQLAGLQHRFNSLKDRLPMLEKLAKKQNITELNALEDVVPLLFEHTMYKSYPPALLEQNRFSDINRWLNKLTTYDLSDFDVSDCECIDDWLIKMDEESPLDIIHSSGTSGTMSFLPRSKDELSKSMRMAKYYTFQNFGEERPEDPDDLGDVYCIFPYFRHGGSIHIKNTNYVVEQYLGSEDNLMCAYPMRMSSDVLYLAARMRAAQAKGELDRLEVNPNLMARMEEFQKINDEMPQHLEKFLDEALEKMQGKRMYIAATWNILHGVADKALEQGKSKLFAPNSVVLSGGGAKGMTPPDNWEDDVCEFFGIDRINFGYGMSEMLGLNTQCEKGHYHLQPWFIPFLLDPETSEVLPREGVSTGRFAFFDLAVDTHWGGFITGDQVTINWDEPCSCGRTTIYIEGEIQRFSEISGEEDKISCAATEGAHKEAMNFLTNIAS